MGSSITPRQPQGAAGVPDSSDLSSLEWGTWMEQN
jgi:hypothetical protein